MRFIRTVVSFSSLKLNTEEIKHTRTEHILSHWNRIPTFPLTFNINYLSMTFKTFLCENWSNYVVSKPDIRESFYSQEHVKK